ncbi:MAG: hypothetical protein SF029_08810 [bacterium]|nr:hypothetical protein [bacterium]
MSFAKAKTWTRLLLRAAVVLAVLWLILLVPALLLGRGITRGAQVAYMSDQPGNWDIFVLDMTTRLTRRLTTADGDDRYPAWSNDGLQIGYHSNTESTYDLMLMDFDGRNPRMLPISQRFQFSQEAMIAWSPDGEYISYHSDAGGYWNLYLSDPAGETAFQVTFNPEEDIRMNWSPDGKMVAFASGRDGAGLEVYVLSVEEMLRFPRAGEIYARRLTDNFDDDWHPVWSPDGTQIAFISRRDLNSEIYIMDRFGREQRNLTNTVAVEEQHPVWTSDGTGLIFSANRHGTDDLFLLTLATGEIRRLTFDNRGNEQAPALWWPQG